MDIDTLELIQKEIFDWSIKQFGSINQSKHPTHRGAGPALYEIPSLLGIVEEIGELVAPVVKMHQGRYRGTPEQAHEDIKDALGDMLIFMCDFASRYEISLADTLWSTWTKVKNRRQTTWNEDKAKENEKLGGTIIEKAMRSECNSGRVEIETASNHTKQKNQEIYAQTGQGFAEPVEINENIRDGFAVAREIATWLEGRNEKKAQEMINRAEREYNQRKGVVDSAKD